MINAVSNQRLRILSQIGDAGALRLPDDLAQQVEVIAVPPSQPIAADLTGDIAVMTFNNTAIYELADHGVRWIHFIGTGLDGFDVPRLTRGRVLTNARGATAVPIAEWTLAMLLYHEKHLADAFVKQKPPRWPAHPGLGTLLERRVALLGLGSIGTAIAQRLLPFGAEIRALRGSNSSSPMPGIHMVDDVFALIDGADHLIVAAALTPKTRHIINTEVLSRAKPGLHLVNIARGELIDQDALRAALDSGVISAASLDVMTPEPPPAEHWLFEHPKVRLSPHISNSSPHTMSATLRIFCDNLRRYLNGEPLVNVIDPQRGY